MFMVVRLHSKPLHKLWNTGYIHMCKLTQCLSAGEERRAPDSSMLCLWWCRVALVAATVNGLNIDSPSVLTAGFRTSFCAVCHQSRSLLFRDVCLFSAWPQAEPQSGHFTTARRQSKVTTVVAGLPFNVCTIVGTLVDLISVSLSDAKLNYQTSERLIIHLILYSGAGISMIHLRLREADSLNLEDSVA